MDAADGASIRLLLVDDDPDVADVTEMHLARQNEAFEIVVENSADAALSHLDGEIDCVVSDYEMPRRDGLEFLRDVRDHDPDLPFVLFTARGSEEIASEAISAGVTDYLQKETGTDQYAVLANRVENAVARRRSERAAAETEIRYRQLVESSPHAIFVHAEGEILYANERAADLYGVDDPADLRGADPLSFVHPEDKETIRDRIGQVVDADVHHDWLESRLLRRDGDVVWVESLAAPVRYEGRSASQVVLRDVTGRRRRLQRLQSLHEATRRLLAAADEETVAQVAVDVLVDVLEEPAAAFWRYDEAADRLRPVAATASVAEGAAEDGAGLPPLPAESFEMSVFRGGEPRMVTGYGDRADAVADALETAYLFPLEDHGLLGAGSVEDRRYDEAEREAIGILARSVIAALDRIERDRN